MSYKDILPVDGSGAIVADGIFKTEIVQFVGVVAVTGAMERIQIPSTGKIKRLVVKCSTGANLFDVQIAMVETSPTDLDIIYLETGIVTLMDHVLDVPYSNNDPAGKVWITITPDDGGPHNYNFNMLVERKVSVDFK